MANQKPWNQEFRRIRELMSHLLRVCAESREPVAEIMVILDRLAEKLDDMGYSSDASSKPEAERLYRRNRPKKYRIVRNKSTLCLAERTEGSKQEFLCPKDVYEALADELAEIDEPAHFDVLSEGVTRRMGRSLPDYPLRVCLRCWLNCDPPLVQRVRTRYKSTAPSRHVRAAKEKWDQLSKLDSD